MQHKLSGTLRQTSKIAIFIDNEKLSISLRLGDPEVPSPEYADGNRPGAYWTVNSVSGTFQKAFAPEPVFVPLYQVKELRKREVSWREDQDREEWEDRS